MNILVTGGTGFLGMHLVPRLLALGHHVRVLGRSPPPPELAPAEYVQGDLLDSAAVARALVGVDAVYHLAGRVSFRPGEARKMFELHVDATRELLRLLGALEKKPRVILASTSGAIAVSREERIGTEDDEYPLTVVGRWPYYLSKIYEEKLALSFCQKENIPLVVLNPALLMGPGDERLSSTWLVAKFLSRDIPSMPRGGLALVDVRDAADAFVQALTKGALYQRYLLGTNLPMPEFFARLERLTGVPAPRLRLPSSLNILGAQLLEKLAPSQQAPHPMEVEMGEHFFYLDASRAQRDLGFRARDVQETLFDTVQEILPKMPKNARPGTFGKMARLRSS